MAYAQVEVVSLGVRRYCGLVFLGWGATKVNFVMWHHVDAGGCWWCVVYALVDFPQGRGFGGHQGGGCNGRGSPTGCKWCLCVVDHRESPGLQRRQGEVAKAAPIGSGWCWVATGWQWKQGAK